MFLAVHCIHACQIGSETRKGAQKSSVVAEKTEIVLGHCTLAGENAFDRAASTSHQGLNELHSKPTL
jgi:hypothetical protein